MIIDRSEIRAFCDLQFCDWNSDMMRQAYEAIVVTWTQAGVPPNQLAASAPGVGKNFGSFKHKRRRLEYTHFTDVKRVSISHMVEGATDPIIQAVVYASLDRHFNRIKLSWVPAMIGGPVHTLIELLPKLASFGKARYGHLLHRNTLDTNRPWWLGMPESVRDCLLFDVYHHTYLNDAHLAAPFGRTAMTLREWIEDDPAERGELKRFTDILTEWTPPIRSIPIIREKLFRAGRMYYYRFFTPYRHRSDGYAISASAAPNLRDQTMLTPEAFYRSDIREPWEWTGPIPDIFSAKYYEGVDDPALVLPLNEFY